MAEIMGRTSSELSGKQVELKSPCKTKRIMAQTATPAFYASEIDTTDCSSLRFLQSHSPKQIRSPKCEAFVMTGDKMLNLNPKISPSYAKVHQNHLPPNVEIKRGDSLRRQNNLLDDFPSMNHQNSDSHCQDRTKLLEEIKSSYENGVNVITSDPNAEYKAQEKGLSIYYDGASSSFPQVFDEFPQSTSQDSDPPVPDLLSRFKSSQSISASPFKRNAADSRSVFQNDRRIQSPRFESTLVSDKSEILNYPEVISRLARHLFSHQEGIKIASFFVKSDELSKRVSLEFISLFNFSGIQLDAALRTFLSHVSLEGETSERERLISYFSNHYHDCNPTLFNSADEIHALTCSLFLLNTDIHGTSDGKKMTSREFIDNLNYNQHSFDRNMLKSLYESICKNPLKQRDKSPSEASATETGNGFPHMVHRGHSSKSLLVNPNHQIDYKHGWILKKSILDSDGKRTPFGRRKWEMLYGTVRGMVFYLHKNERSFSGNSFETFNNCILLHHSLAEIPKDYTKRKDVFRLRTAKFGEYLFQTSEQEEVQKWIDIINYVAAAFSTPALPTPISSSGTVTFYRPLLPSTPTTFSLTEQLLAHEQRLEETVTNLVKLRENAPSINSKGKAVYEYFYRERFLDKERERYCAYVKILSEKMGRSTRTNGQGDPSQFQR